MSDCICYTSRYTDTGCKCSISNLICGAYQQIKQRTAMKDKRRNLSSPGAKWTTDIQVIDETEMGTTGKIIEKTCTEGIREIVDLLRFASMDNPDGLNYGAVIDRAAVPGTSFESQDAVKVESRHSCRRFEGIFWSSIVGLTQALLAICTKYLKDFSAMELSTYQAAGTIIFTIPVIIFRLPEMTVALNKPNLMYLFLGGIANFGFFMCTAMAYQMLPLGDASTIIFSLPIFTAILARVFLKEHLSRLTVVSIVISVVGLCLTIKLPLILSSPDLTQRIGTLKHVVGCCVALLDVLCCSVANVITRKLKNMHSAMNISLQYVIAFIITLSVSPAFGGFHMPSCSLSSWVLVLMMLLAFACGWTWARALQLEDAVVVTTLMRGTDITAAFLFQILIFNEPVDAYSASGTALLVASGLLLPLQRWMESQPEDSSWKSNCLLK